LTGLLKLQDAFEAFKKDPKYSSNQGQRAFIGYLNESKAKVNDTSETYYGFTTDEIILNNGIMEKPTVESIKQEEAIHPDTENKIDTTAEKPETPEEKTLTITKTRLRQTIDRYIEKIKGLKNAKEDEKNTLKDEIKILKEELAKQKNDYEAAKNFFLGTTEYKTGEL